jgi:hypothetical protein
MIAGDLEMSYKMQEKVCALPQEVVSLSGVIKRDA